MGNLLDRMVNIAGGLLWAPRAALIPVLDLLHHHGQICYLQTLLGDREQHWDEDAIKECFGRPTTEATPERSCGKRHEGCGGRSEEISRTVHNTPLGE